MFNSKPNNTAELEGTLVQLDALYKSYETVLQSAQEQLEALALSDSDYDKLLERALRNQDLLTKLGNNASLRVIEAITKDDGGRITDYLTKEVTARVSKELEETLEKRLADVVTAIIDSETFERAVDVKMCENQTIKDCIDVTATLKSLVRKVMPDQGLYC